MHMVPDHRLHCGHCKHHHLGVFHLTEPGCGWRFHSCCYFGLFNPKQPLFKELYSYRVAQSYLRVIHTRSAGFRLDAWLKEITCSAKQMHSRKRTILLPTCIFYFLGRYVTDVVSIGSIFIQDCDLCWHSFKWIYVFIFILFRHVAIVTVGIYLQRLIPSGRNSPSVYVRKWNVVIFFAIILQNAFKIS